MNRAIDTRPVTMDDVIAAGRALQIVPARLRGWALRRMLREATVAAARWRITGRVHPFWGDGTLMTAALRRPCGAERRADDPDFRACLIDVLKGLGPQPRAQDRHRAIPGFASSRAGAISSPQSVQ